jgi:malonyl-CoA O-methyltransferase
VTGVFVTGTDTGVGKTVVAACLVRAWRADYWKPVQTGMAATSDDTIDDTNTVVALAGLSADHVYAPAYALQAPLSPHAAAELEDVAITMDAITLPLTTHPLVVEGAGGLLVPLNDREFMIDLMARLALPALLVARSTLGTINHTLLSLSALRSRGLPIAGVVLNGPPNAGNRAAIERFGQARVLAELPPVDPLDRAAIERLSALIPPLQEIAP